MESWVVGEANVAAQNIQDGLRPQFGHIRMCVANRLLVAGRVSVSADGTTRTERQVACIAQRPRTGAAQH